MENRDNSRDTPIVIDMTLEGDFREAPAPTWAERIGRVAVIVAVLAIMIALIGFVLFAMAIAIPVAAGAMLVAWAMFRWQAWKAGR